jgi:hypothetical protein
MTDDVSVRFGGQTDGLNQAVTNAMRPIAAFSDRVKDLNAQLSALDAPVKSVGAAADSAAKDTDKLSFATAGATREFIVIGHEVMTGNFSRIPGSLVVLAERAGGLHSLMEGVTAATLGWAAAIAATLYGVYEWIAADEHLAEVQNTVRGAMELNNQALSFNADVLEQNITRMRLFADVSKDDAEKIVVAFSRAGNMSVELKQKLLEMVGDYAAATGKTAPKAAEDLIKMFSDPARGAKELAATFQGVLTPAQLEQIETLSKNGKAMEMQGVLFDALGEKIDGFRADHLTPLQKSWEELTNLFVKFGAADQLKPGQSWDDKSSGSLPAKTDPAAAEQEHQNELNRTITAGFQIEQQSGLLVARKNALLERQAELVKAANAAETRGDSQTARRFRDDAAEVQQQINALKARGQREAETAAKAAQREKEQLAREGVTFEQQMGRLSLANEKTILDEKVTLGEITNKQRYAQLQKLALDEYNLENEALLKESRLGGLSVVDKQKVDDQMLLLHQKYLNQKDALTRKSLADEKKQFDQVFQGINRAFTQSINGILQGTQTWQQATANIFTGVLSVFVDMAEKMVAKWLESLLLNAVYGKTEAAGQIATSAAAAGAGAYSATALIPYVGPVLAPAAAATAYANTMAFEGLASFDVGSWDLPSDQVARVHEGEMIIPKPFADSMRENGGLGGGDTYHIHAVDAQSFVKMLKSNSAAITGIVGGGIRNFSSNLKPA